MIQGFQLFHKIPMQFFTFIIEKFLWCRIFSGKACILPGLDTGFLHEVEICLHFCLKGSIFCLEAVMLLFCYDGEQCMDEGEI